MHLSKVLLGMLSTTMCLFASPRLDLLISSEEIDQKLEHVAQKLNQAYQEEPLTVIVVMKGALCIASDLIRKLTMPVYLQYIKASSYGNRGSVRGDLVIEGLSNLALEGKRVLIVDDIFDSGHTMTSLMSQITSKGPKEVKSLVLLSKNIQRPTSYRPDYVLFDIEDRFVVGCGLDYKELYRNLPAIYVYYPE